MRAADLLTRTFIVLVVVDAAKAVSGKAQGAEDYLFERLKEFSIPASLILNKVGIRRHQYTYFLQSNSYFFLSRLISLLTRKP